MGAWIETIVEAVNQKNKASHPTWVRGLKLMVMHHVIVSTRSHPTWVRGLKHNRAKLSGNHPMSHPTWVRGLKLLLFEQSHSVLVVAPYVGAWIETYI